jgi:Short C-terminal domain
VAAVFYIIGLAVGLILWGPLAYNMAKNRGRQVWVWYATGVLLGFIPLIVLGILGKTDAKKEAEIQEVAAAAKAMAGSTPRLGHVEELQGLAELHDKGALTDEEYAHEKEHVLAS